MTVAKRARLAPEQRRAQLIELGLQMLAKRPLEDLSVEAIAEEAGISRGLLFHYFASKQEFHLAVAHEAARMMLERTAPDRSLPMLEQLAGSLSAMIDYVTENSDVYISLVRGAASGDAEMRELFEQTRSVNAERILEAFPAFDLERTAGRELATHGWVAFAEETIVRWLRSRNEWQAQSALPGVLPPLSRDQLLLLLSSVLLSFLDIPDL